MKTPETRRSIRFRLSLGSAGLAAILTGLALVGVYWGTGLLLRFQVDDQLEHEIEDLEARHDQGGWRGLAE